MKYIGKYLGAEILLTRECARNVSGIIFIGSKYWKAK